MNRNSSTNGSSASRQAIDFHKSASESSFQTRDIKFAQHEETGSSWQNSGLVFSERPRRGPLGLRWSSLRTKAMVLALAIGIAPVVLVGTAAYFNAGQAIREQILQNEQTNANDLQDKLNIFVNQRYDDIIELSKLDIFANPKVRNILTLEEKNDLLNDYIASSGFYDSIAVYDFEGKVIAVSDEQINASQLPGTDYTQKVKDTDQAVIVDPRVSSTTGKFSFFIAAPIKDQDSGKTIAVVRARVPMPLINDLFGVDPARGQAFYLTDSKGQIAASSDPDALQKPLEELFPAIASQLQPGRELATVAAGGEQQQLFTYVPNSEIANDYALKWGLLLARPTAIAFAPQQQLLFTVLVGTVLVALLVAAIVIVVVNRATRPILAATEAVERIGQGELDTRLAVKGEDELALLGSNINSMAEQITTLLQEQALAAEEQRRQREELQERALELLEEVDPINEGDLTVRARVTEDDIGTIADSYNVTVSNLRDIVAKVQVAASNVTGTTRNNEMSIKMLSKEALYQAERIAAALEQVKEMAGSVRLVAANAERASAIVQRANQMVEEGDAAMDQTVEGINAIRETVAETRQKVKYLGESSQKITAVVNLISSFAAQTKLLAFNASIEANRAGQEGRGFAVVADEVRSLAQQSAEASTEIEKLVATIQGETNEVIAAMEAGTEQVVVGTKLVENTRQSLNKITAASMEISELVSAISQATIQQAGTAETVTHTMADVAEIASRTSKEADQVVSSFEELRQVAEELQQDTSRFKVS